MKNSLSYPVTCGAVVTCVGILGRCSKSHWTASSSKRSWIASCETDLQAQEIVFINCLFARELKSGAEVIFSWY